MWTEEAAVEAAVEAVVAELFIEEEFGFEDEFTIVLSSSPSSSCVPLARVGPLPFPFVCRQARE